MDIATLYCQSIHKEYRLAFDLAVNFVDDQCDSIIAAVGSPQWALELIRRVNTSIYFIDTGDFNVHNFIENAQAWTKAKVSLYHPGHQEKFGGIIWVNSKQKSNQKEVMPPIIESTNTSKLALISPGLMHHFLPKTHEKITGSENIGSLCRSLRYLRKTNWQCQSCVGLHGCRSILYSFAVRLSGALGRPDWRDRCIFSSSRVYQSSGWLSPLSTLIITFHHRHQG